jgi:hypothetical protein
MKTTHWLLPLASISLAFVGALRSQPFPSALRSDANTTYLLWTPIDTVKVECFLGIIELEPPTDPTQRPSWSSPVHRPGVTFPGNEGNQLTVPFDLVWRSDSTAPGIKGTREAEYIDRRLIIRDTWQLAKTKANATTDHQFVFNMADYPDIELDLIEPEAGQRVVRPRVRDHADQLWMMFSQGMHFKGKGFIIKNIGGNEIRIHTNEIMMVSPQVNTTENTIGFRFMPIESGGEAMSKLDNGLSLDSGDALFILEWVASPAAPK